MFNNLFQIPTATSVKTHTLTSDVTFEWLHDGQVVNVVLNSLSQQSVDTYVDTTIALIKTYPEDQIVLFLLDVTHLSRLNLYFKDRLEDINAVLHETNRKSRAAVVIPTGLAASVFLLFSRAFTPRLPVTTVSRLFQDRDKALRWLVDALDD